MNNLMKSIFCVTVSITFFIACETWNDYQELEEEFSKIEDVKHNKSYSVKIELIDRFDQLVGSNGLRGYFAINQDTGEIFYPLRSDDDNVFRLLPEGSYRFDAYDGYFDGASSSLVTLSDELVDSSGYIIVTLRYWSE